jgi:hypothetical protein
MTASLMGNPLGTFEGATQTLETPRGIGSPIGLFMPVFNVKAPPFLAKGDGVADDTAAIQLAINTAIAAKGGAVFFPPGMYITTTPLTVTVSTNNAGVAFSLIGPSIANSEIGGVDGEPAGFGAAIKYRGTTGDLLLLSLTAGGTNSRIVCQIENLLFIGNLDVGGAASGGGLHFQALSTLAATRTALRNVYVTNAKDNGIWLDGTQHCTWFDVWSCGNGLRGFYASSSVGSDAISPESRFYNLELYHNTSNGGELANSVGHPAFLGLTTILNGGSGFVVGTGNDNCRFYNIESENNVAINQLVFNSNGTLVSGCQIRYSVGTQVGMVFTGFQNVVSGVNTNSAASQIDFNFSGGNAHSTTITGWMSGDLLFDGSHISDSGFANSVSGGARGQWGPLWPKVVPLTAAGAGAVNLRVDQSSDFIINITANVAITPTASFIAEPGANLTQRLRVVIKNSSGGALTTPATFAAGANQFVATGTVSPANGLQVGVHFEWDQVAARYIEVARGAAV